MVFEYSYNEKYLMSVITGISNFACLPGILLMSAYNRPYELFMGIFTMITSFMYHVTESIDVDIYITPGKWHELDNIGSICCINSLLISLMNGYKNKDIQLRLNLFSLIIVLTMQANNPWDLFNTVFPIVIFITILIVDFIRNGLPKYNSNPLKKGIGIFLLALSMFIKGLDEHSDYLRLAHSLWHVSVGYSTFYLWQVHETKVIGIFEVFKYLRNY
jgi:hypothetical protein